MSRFDPKKVEQQVVFGGSDATGSTPNIGIWVSPDRYRELYEAAEAMAEAIEFLASHHRTNRMDAALARFRGEDTDAD